MGTLKKLYAKLPVIRELREMRLELGEATRHLYKTRYFVERQADSTREQLTLALLSQDKHRDPKSLMQYGFQAFSQNNEDGMIAEIFHRIGTDSSYFIEIGVGDGLENNTSFLLLQHWRGCWVEGNQKDVEAIKRTFQKQISDGDLNLIHSFVKAEDIVDTLWPEEAPPACDLFSLDIDQNTFWIWEAIGRVQDFRPRVVVMEYNASMGPSIEWAVEYDPDRVWDNTIFFGASLKSFELLGKRLDYSLVGCDITGINAFFVRNDLVGNKFASPFTSENHFLPPRYFLTRRQGHLLRPLI